MEWSTLSGLTFEQPDLQRFPALGLAYDVIAAGGTAGAVFNAANERAVDAFLGGQIAFGAISSLVEKALTQIDLGPADELETILEADLLARQYVESQITDS